MSAIMARPSEVPGKPATERITIRANTDMVAFIDRKRGPDSRAAYLRNLVRLDAQGKVQR